MKDSLSRRDFLVYGGATIAGVTLGEAGRRHLARADAQAETWTPRAEERWAATVCRECPAGCGARVRLMDGVPVKLEGNPLCPIGRGHLCAKGQAAIESYYDPDRLVGPARRVARGREARWERLAWSDAIRTAADRVKRADQVDDGLIVIAADEHGPLADAWTRFWTAAGAQLAWTPAPTAARFRTAFHDMTGAEADPVFDVERASYLLSFGAPLAEDWLSGLWAQRSFGRFRRGTGRARGRLVQIDSRRSATARKADEWLAVALDQQVVLAHGIASVLLRENRIDRSRLDPIAGNLDAFEHQVVSYYTPDTVSAATGVPVVTILRLARELTSAAQPLVIVDTGAPPPLVDAVLALNAVIGAFDRTGGVFAKQSDAGTSHEDALPLLQLVAEGHVKPRVLVLADSSALRGLDSPADMAALTSNAEFIVSLSPYLDEAASIADLLLPTDVPIESWHALVPPAAIGAEAIAVAGPAVPRRLETQDRAALLRAIATSLGGRSLEACTWRSSEDLARAEVARLAHLRRGTPYVSSYETQWVHQLESGGWWVSSADTEPAIAERVVAAGGWVDPWFETTQLTDAVRSRGGLAFPVPDSPPPVRRASAEHKPTELAALGVDLTPARSNTARFPLKLIAFTPPTASLAGNANEPALFELLGQPEGKPWRAWVEMSPETAAQYDIAEGAGVHITSAFDSVDAVAVHVAGMAADTMAIPFVPGGATGGRWARLAGADPRRLWGGDSRSGACAVRIAPAS